MLYRVWHEWLNTIVAVRMGSLVWLAGAKHQIKLGADKFVKDNSDHVRKWAELLEAWHTQRRHSFRVRYGQVKKVGANNCLPLLI